MVRLYDETIRDLREVEIRPRMTVYVCGITPYDAAHLGHAFTYVQFDVLVRYLRHLGAEVVHAQNVTDVDDDMLRVSRERGIDYSELARQEVEAFEKAMRAIGVLPPTHSPWASAFIPQILRSVQGLMAAGHGYERDGTVYFRVASDPGYGRLSRLDRQTMLDLAAERGGRPDDPAKDDPLDFVLWQRSAPGEPSWDSPWGQGRPGWHIECSTMAREILGNGVDIHGGGSDLIFPHHESELAQAEGQPGGTPFVRHWMHTGSVECGPDKMSKSLGNMVFVRDLLDRHDGAAIREFLLRHHYRQDWKFDEDDLEAAAGLREGSREPASGWAGAADRDAFFRALDDDLDVPQAMRVLDRARASSDREAQAFVEEGEALLGLDL